MKSVINYLWCLPLLMMVLTATAQDQVYEIQLGTYAAPDYKKFKSLHEVGYVYARELDNGLYKILMGTYDQRKTAQRRLDMAQRKGFKDAFLVRKSVQESDAVYIVQMATYDQQADIYWPDWQRLTNRLCAQLSADRVRVASGPYYTRAEAEEALNRIQARGPKDGFIKRVSEEVLHKVTQFDLARSSFYKGNTGAVRNSVKALQEILSQNDLYDARPNGMLTATTKGAMIRYKKTNEMYIRHRVMAEELDLPEIERYTLQDYVNKIPADPQQAAAGLKQFKNPIAKIYLAYLYFQEDISSSNKSATVNKLMNDALTQVFKGYRGKTRYDFSLKYAYEELDQLLAHLRATYEVLKERPDIPCWLFERHPKLMRQVFEPYWYSRRDDYTVSTDCGSFMDSEEMRILWVVSKDFAEQTTDLKDLATINRYYVVPEPIPHQDIEALEKWNGNLWRNLERWSLGSPLQKNMYELLRFSYYDALQQLETHFMTAGMPGIEARSLGLKILKQSIGKNMTAYF